MFIFAFNFILGSSFYILIGMAYIIALYFYNRKNDCKPGVLEEKNKLMFYIMTFCFLSAIYIDYSSYMVFTTHIESIIFIHDLKITSTIFLVRLVYDILTLLILIYSYNMNKRVKNIYLFEFFIYLSTFSIAISLLTVARQLFFAHMIIESISLTLYIFLGINKFSSLAIEAALKYFILSAFSSAIGLFGISLLNSYYGT